MLNKFLITALLAATVDGGTVKRKPTAKQLGSPRVAMDAGTAQGGRGTRALTATTSDAGSLAALERVTAAADGGFRRTDGGTFMGAVVSIRAGASDAGTATAKTPPAKKSEMAPEVRTLVERMQAFYEGTSDFKANFTQNYSYKAFKRTQTSSGTVVFKKPGLMRWEYEKPAKKSFVLAGDTVYAHDPEAMLLTVAGINTNQLSASVTFLWGKGKLQDEFSIQKVACTNCKGTLLELTPLTPDPRFQKVKLEVDPKSAQVLKSTVIDPDGSENAITFSGLQANTGVGADHFKMNPPQGTQVQDFRKKP